MGKLESTMRSEIIRLAKREVRKITVPLGKNVRTMKSTVSRLRKAVVALEQFAARRVTQMGKGQPLLEAPPEQVKMSRLSPRLIRVLRKRLGITQKEMATLVGVTVGAIYQWEKGTFEPTEKKKRILVALRQVGRRDLRKVLEEKMAEKAKRKMPARRPKRGSRK